MKKSSEMLPPPKFINLLRQRIDQLSKTIQFLQKQLKIAPQGTLRVSKSHNSLQYYLRDTKNNKNGVYLKKNQKALIQKLAQKSYNIKTLKNIQAELDSASKYYSFLSSNADTCVSKSFDTLEIIPVTYRDDQFVSDWLKQPHSIKAFSESTAPLYTSKGIRVRSKSELLIAECLEKYHIPFLYETPLVLEIDSRSVAFSPDFKCLDIAKRKEILWEHFGLMEVPEYAQNAVNKIRLYQEKGFVIGRDIVFTFETNTTPLTMLYLEKFVKSLFTA